MPQRFREFIADIGRAMRRFFYRVTDALSAARVTLAALALLVAAGYAMYQHPPIKTVARGELGVRYNRFTGNLHEWREGSAWVLPGLHDVRVFSLRDQVYRPTESSRADGPAPSQSIEGLSLGVDLSVRYALDAARLQAAASPGEVVIAASTHRLVGRMFDCRALGADEVKGLPQPVEAWQVDSAAEPITKC